MIIIVLPNLNFSKKFIISSSFFLSKELVGSSKIINSGSLYNALANPNLCFSPIDKLVPPSDISYDGSNFSNFVSLNKNDLTVPNLKQLEGKFILLEWNGGDFWGTSQITNCSFISFMRIYKVTDRDKENEEWFDEGIYVCEAKRKYTYDLPAMFYKVSNHIYEYLTTSNFELQNYSFTYGYGDTTTWSYKWKIWIPTDCYKRYFGSTYYKMCLRRLFDRDIAYKICSFI